MLWSLMDAYSAESERRDGRPIPADVVDDILRGEIGMDGYTLTERALTWAAGITAVSGSFAAGDPVDLCDLQGVVVARGLVNFDSAEVPTLLGRSTTDLKRELGAAYEREVVHRDDLVLL